MHSVFKTKPTKMNTLNLFATETKNAEACHNIKQMLHKSSILVYVVKMWIQF